MRRMVKAVIAGFMLALLLVGCEQTAPHKEVLVGVVWPFAASNNYFSEGVDLAVKEINRNGGINGKALRLLKKDDDSELEKGLVIAQSFAENKSIRAVIGHEKSFISIPASAIYEEAGLIMLSPASTASELTQNGFQNVFRSIASDDEIARQLALYSARQGHRRMVIFYSDDSYGNGLANAFQDHAREQGITVVDRFNSYTGPEDLRHLSLRWQAYGADGIFLARSMPGGEQIIFDAAQVGIKLPLVGGDALEAPLLERPDRQAAEGMVIGSFFNPYADRSEVKQFVQDFRREYKIMPSADAALGYDAVKIIAEAIKRTDNKDRTAVADGLRSLGRWPGVCGIHELTPNGDDRGDLIVLKKMQDGKFIYLQK